jgi:hypothetical protein
MNQNRQSVHRHEPLGWQHAPIALTLCQLASSHHKVNSASCSMLKDTSGQQLMEMTYCRRALAIVSRFVLSNS